MHFLAAPVMGLKRSLHDCSLRAIEREKTMAPKGSGRTLHKQAGELKLPHPSCQEEPRPARVPASDRGVPPIRALRAQFPAPPVDTVKQGR